MWIVANWQSFSSKGLGRVQIVLEFHPLGNGSKTFGFILLKEKSISQRFFQALKPPSPLWMIEFKSGFLLLRKEGQLQVPGLESNRT
jgi:hypothetical protein